MDNPQLIQKAVDLHAQARILLLSGKTNEALSKLETAIQHLTRAKKGELTVRGQQAIQFKIEDIQKLIDDNSKQLAQNNVNNQVPSNTPSTQTQNNNTQQNNTTTPTTYTSVPPVNPQLNQFIAEGVSFANQAVAEDSKGSLQNAIQYYTLAVQAMNKACQVTTDETFQYKLIAQLQQYLERIHQLQNVVNQAAQAQQKTIEAASQASNSNAVPNSPPQPTPSSVPAEPKQAPSSVPTEQVLKVPPSYSPIVEQNSLPNIPMLSSESEDATADELMMQAIDAARLESAKESAYESEVLSHMILNDVEGMSETEKRALEAELRGMMNSEEPKEHKKKNHKKK